MLSFYSSLCLESCRPVHPELPSPNSTTLTCMVAFNIVIRHLSQIHMARAKTRKQGNATLFPLIRESRICKRGQWKRKSKNKTLNETCDKACCTCVPVSSAHQNASVESAKLKEKHGQGDTRECNNARTTEHELCLLFVRRPDKPPGMAM